MKPRFIKLWDRLRASYWFIPTLMVVGALLLALVAGSLDRSLRFETVESLRWLYSGGPEGARQLLSTIAGSMITVGGVTFSVTIVALVMATSQFGPRILGHFMRDTGNQIVLGTFVATFIYCLAALRTVRGMDDAEFVPRISVTLGFALALAGIGVLIYFIDHVATSIQAPQVVRRVGRDLDSTLDEVFPEEPEEERGATRGDHSGAEKASMEEEERSGKDQAGLDASTTREAGGSRPEGRPVETEKTGYVQMVDSGALLSAARDAGVRLEMACRVGDYLIPGSHLAAVRPAEGVDGDLEDRVRNAFLFGSSRTEKQDAEFVLNRLVEIATRALSPSLNDPYTALNCIDRLSGALSRIVRRPVPSTRLRDDDGVVRVQLRPITFPDLVLIAFDRIREYGAGHTVVLVRLLEAVTGLARLAERQPDRRALREQADRVLRAGRRSLKEEPDLEELEDRHRRAIRAIRSGPNAPGGPRDGDGPAGSV